jgi:hypothetical protein
VKKDFKTPNINYDLKESPPKERNALTSRNTTKGQKYELPVHKKQKSSLNKFINKQPNYLKGTTGSKTRKRYGTEKANEIRNNSREKSIRENKILQRNLQKQKQEKEKDDNLDDLIQLADEFWDNVPLDESIKSKRVVKKVRVPISERHTKSSMMKNTTARPIAQKLDNKYYHNKFKSKFKPVTQRNTSSASKRKRTVPKRVISTTREIGIKMPKVRYHYNINISRNTYTKRTKKVKESEPEFYSPIQSKEKGKLTNAEESGFSDHNYDIDLNHKKHSRNESVKKIYIDHLDPYETHEISGG